VTEDPFDTLERQLRDAVQRRRRRRVPRGLLATAAALALGGGVAAAAGVLGGSGDDAAVKRALFAGSSRAHRTAACTVRAPRTAAPQVVAGRPSPPVLAQLGIFRRPAAAADRVPPSRLVMGAVLSDGVRVARAVDGTRYVLLVSRGTPRFPGAIRDPVGCARAEHDASIAAAAHDTAAVRARVRRIVDARLASMQRAASGATETLTAMLLLPNGHLGSGGATLIVNGHLPATGAIGFVRVRDKPRVELSGVIPDGVASVRIVDRDGPRARRAHPTTVAVRDNVFHVLLPRRMGPRMTEEWHAPDGHVVRRLHPRY
jgi:hypothetical protein